MIHLCNTYYSMSTHIYVRTYLLWYIYVILSYELPCSKGERCICPCLRICLKIRSAPLSCHGSLVVKHLPRERSVMGSNPTWGSFFFGKKCLRCSCFPCLALSLGLIDHDYVCTYMYTCMYVCLLYTHIICVYICMYVLIKLIHTTLIFSPLKCRVGSKGRGRMRK